MIINQAIAMKRNTRFVWVLLTLFGPETCCNALSSSTISSSSSPAIATPSKASFPPTTTSREEVKKSMLEFHASEVDSGREAFHHGGSVDSRTIQSSPTTTILGDEHFLGREIGFENAGMDANYLPQNGNMVFESLLPIVTDEECSTIIEEAQNVIAQGLMEEQENNAQSSQRTNAISNSRLGEARLSNMPQTRAWLRETLLTRFYPLLHDRFGIGLDDDLVLYDGLVLGNQAPTRSQPIHRDASLLTLNVALSDPNSNYDGGGTYLEALDEILVINKGHLLTHAGSSMHAGNAITRGERWVFVLFLLDPNQPQLARRCHAQAIANMQEGKLEQAQTVLSLGLESIAPHHDHLLHNTMGRLHLANMNQETDSKIRRYHQRLALQSFETADAAYPLCPNALVAASTLLLEQNRPRAALRRLDRLLETIGTRDAMPSAQMSLKARAYGARRDAARCALVGADYLYHKSATRKHSKTHQNQLPSWASWSIQHLPIAMERLNTCLRAAPNEPSLLGMLDRADDLYVKAVQTRAGLHEQQ